MDITKWKSVAVRINDYKILKALCDEKFRNPASMISKLTHDYVKFRAGKSKTTVDAYLKKLLKK